MRNALNAGWLPDRRLLGETADWITEQLPWWLRWSPLIAVAMIGLLGLGLSLTRIPVPHTIAVAVQECRLDEHGATLQLRAPQASEIPAVGSTAVLRIVNNGSDHVARVPGTITGVAPVPGMIVITAIVERRSPVDGSGVLIVPTGSERLWDILLRRLQTRGGI